MTEEQAIATTVAQFTRFNPTLVNCVNKKAKTMETFEDEVYAWMENNIPVEYHDTCYNELLAAVWSYDILVPYIDDDGAISDVACHDWNNVWIQVRGKWKRARNFRDEDHYTRFFNHVCIMNGITSSVRNASANCTDLETFSNFRLRLNFIHKSINTNNSNIFSIRKISNNKKTFEILTHPEEGMITPDMIPIIKKHINEATGILIVGMGGSGKTTFLNALIEELPLSWKFLFIQENEELFSNTHLNSDFLKTVRPQNQYDVSHDLKELARNGLLMSIKCFVIGEIKGDEAAWLFNVTNTGAVGLATLHSDSSRHGLDKLCDYIKYATDYSKPQCLEMLTILNKVIFLKDYRVREITTIHGYDSEHEQLIMDTEYYDPNPRTDIGDEGDFEACLREQSSGLISSTDMDS